MAEFTDSTSFRISQTDGLETGECFATPKRTIGDFEWWLECFPKGKGAKDTALRVMMRVSEAPVKADVDCVIEGTKIKDTSKCVFQKAKNTQGVMQLAFCKVPSDAVITCNARFYVPEKETDSKTWRKAGDSPPATEALSSPKVVDAPLALEAVPVPEAVVMPPPTEVVSLPEDVDTQLAWETLGPLNVDAPSAMNTKSVPEAVETPPAMVSVAEEHVSVSLASNLPSAKTPSLSSSASLASAPPEDPSSNKTATLTATPLAKTPAMMKVSLPLSEKAAPSAPQSAKTVPSAKSPSKSTKSTSQCLTDVAVVTLNQTFFNEAGKSFSTPKRRVNLDSSLYWWLDVYPCGNNPTVAGQVLIFVRVSMAPVDVVAEYSVDDTDISLTVKHRYQRIDALACVFGQSHLQLIKAGVFGKDSFSITCRATFSIPDKPNAPLPKAMAKVEIPKKKRAKWGRICFSDYSPNDLILNSPDFLVGIPLSMEVLENAKVEEMYKTPEYTFPGNFDYSYQLYVYPCGDRNKSAQHISVFAEFRTLNFVPFVVTGKWGLSVGNYEKAFTYTFYNEYDFGGFAWFISHDRLAQFGVVDEGGVTVTFRATVKPLEPEAPKLPSQIAISKLDGALVVGVERVPVRTEVLAFISPIFRERFERNRYDTDISLLEYDVDTIKTLLDLIHGKLFGKILTPYLCCKMLEFAVKFNITAIQRYLEHWLQLKLSAENFYEVAECAWTAPSEVLQMACGRFLNGHMSMVVNHPTFLKMNGETMKNVFAAAQKHPRWLTSYSSGRFSVIRDADTPK